MPIPPNMQQRLGNGTILIPKPLDVDSIMRRNKVTPYWRTIRDDGALHERFPGGVTAQAAKLRREGLTIRPGRRKGTLCVRDFEKRLIKA